MKLAAAIKLAVAVLFAGCGKSDEGPKPPPTIEGSCKVSVSGPATFEETMQVGKHTAISQWSDAETRKRFGRNQNLALACEGKQVSASFGVTGTEKELPLRPTKYILEPGSRLLIERHDHPALIAGFVGRIDIPGASDRWLVADKGTLDITTFDARRIAGMFEVDATFLLESGRLGNAKIRATFDFTCSGTCN